MESKRIHKAENIAVSDWFGYKEYKFTVDGRESLIVCPEHPLDGNPWVWRAEFFSAFDWVDRALLERGWHIAYHKVSDMYGNPESVGMLHDFYLTVTKEFALSRRPAIFGFSRGALYAVNYAAAYPDECGILYLDAPVTDVFVWPGRFKQSNEWAQCKECYGITDADEKTFHGNPNDMAEKNARDGIPCFICAGDADTVVDFNGCGKIYYERYRAISDRIEMIVKPGCDHHPHSLSDPTPIVNYIEKYAEERGCIA